MRIYPNSILKYTLIISSEYIRVTVSCKAYLRIFFLANMGDFEKKAKILIVYTLFRRNWTVSQLSHKDFREILQF